MMRLVSIVEIMEKVYETADEYYLEAGPREWLRMIKEKTYDQQTPAIIRAIERVGFIDPICIEDHGSLGWYLGNGHHRLAIAILLGLDEILVDFSSDYSLESTRHDDLIEADYRNGDAELARWISTTAIAAKDLAFQDPVRL